MGEYQIKQHKKEKKEARKFCEEMRKGFLESLVEGLTEEEIEKRQEECNREGHKKPLFPMWPEAIMKKQRNVCGYCGREYEEWIPPFDDSLLYRRVTI